MSARISQEGLLIVNSSTLTKNRISQEGLLALVQYQVKYSNIITSTPGLVSYYQLNETTGTTATDSWGSNNGTYQGTPPNSYGLGTTSVSSNLGTSVSFSNGTGNISIPN